MLIDPPGLGKTLQAAEAAERPVLIAAPTYLTEQWYEFLTTQYPDDTVVLAEGSRSKRLAALRKEADWTIINTEMLRTYKMPAVQTLIIDESHHVRNRTARQSKGAFDVARVTPRVYLLTATPIWKEPDDLYMQLRILDPKTFKSYWQFVEAFCKVIKTPWAYQVVGAKDKEQLRKLISYYAMGRSYEEVGLELPPLIESRVLVTPTKQFMEAYRKLKEEYTFQGLDLTSMASALQSLRQLTACREKLTATVNLINDVGMGHGVVVFTWYVETAKTLGNLLNAPVITGEMPASERKRVAKGANLVVATLASLSEGVDLSHARTVVFFEEDYTPGRMYQALCRVRRWSHDTTPVRAYTVILKGTVDEVVHRAIGRRVSNIRAIVKEALQ